MSDESIKHFIIVRFFPRQNADYPHDIFDTDFLSKQLIVAKNILRSLENQTNKNFELIFELNKKHFSDKKYAFVFATLRNSTTLPITFEAFGSGKLEFLLGNAYYNYDYVIQSRMDFDDFIFKDAVADTQSKVRECENVLSYGYCKGYMYFDGELYSYPYLSDGQGHLGIMQSLIFKSSFADKLRLFSVYKGGHHRVKPALKNFLEANGISFSENMFQQNTSTNAYIYFRHEFSNDTLVHKRDPIALVKLKKLTLVKYIAQKQLEEEFGFFYDLKPVE